MTGIDVTAIDVLMYAHKALKAQQQVEFPGKSVPHRFGAEIFAGSIVMMSSLMQAYVENVFESSFKRKFMHLKSENDVVEYWKSVGNWGNPNENNINRLFLRLGIIKVLSDFNFDQIDHSSDMKKLKALNEIRNKIAHGEIKYEYAVDGIYYKLSQGEMGGWRNFVYNFGSKFEAYVESKQV